MFIGLIFLVAVYIAGFFIMFALSAWRDGQHEMESDVLDTFITAVFWPFVLLLIACVGVLDAFRMMFCQVYGFFYKIGKGKR
jgi:hypothetical protein